MVFEWLCAAIGVLLLLGFLVGLIALLAKLLNPRKPAMPTRIAGSAQFDDLNRAESTINDLLQLQLIDQVTYGRVIAALQVARSRRQPPPIPVLPVATPFTPELRTVESPAKSHPPVAGLASRPPPSPKPRAPRRSLSDVLAGFMHESNIRWGELVGGMLIVGCSVALVISFWSEIAHRLFLQFGVFTTVTVATLGLGLYAEHRWKLPTTSRGILLIATMLVPLNFLAFAALSHGVTPSTVETVVEILVLMIFGFLIWRAAGVLSPYWPHVLALGIAGTSAILLASQQVRPARTGIELFALPAAILAVYGGAIGLMLRQAGRWKQIRGHVADAMLLVLGVLTFAAALGLGLAVSRAEDAWAAAHQLVPLLSLAATPALATGLLIWRRVSNPRFGVARTAGTAVAASASLLTVGAILLAWPDPSSMLPLSVANFVVLAAVALFFEIPLAHLLATISLLVAYLVGFHVAVGRVGWSSNGPVMFQTLTAPSGGPALVPLFAIALGVAFILRRFKRESDARIYARFAAVVAAISIALVSRASFNPLGDVYGAAWVYLFYSAVAYVVAWRSREPGFAWTGCLLLVAASAEIFIARTHVTFPWSISLLAGSTVLAVGAVVLRRLAVPPTLREPVRWTAGLAAAGAILLLVPSLSIANCGTLGPLLLWGSAIGFVIALGEGLEIVFVAAQVVLAAAITCQTIGAMAKHAWFARSNMPLLEPWTLEAVGAALGALCLGFALLRVLLPRDLSVRRWIGSELAFDKVMVTLLVAGLGILIAMATQKAVSDEFALPATPLMFDLWSAHATGTGSWLVLATLLLSVIVWILCERKSNGLVLLLILAALACCLGAARWADQTATASALRWLLAAMLAAISTGLWLRGQLPSALRRLPGNSPGDARTVLVLLCAVPILALSLYPAGLTLQGIAVRGTTVQCFFGRIGNSASYVVPLAVVAVVFAGHALRERSSGWASAASSVCNLTVTLGYALSVATSHQHFDEVRLDLRACGLCSWHFGQWWATRSSPGGRVPRCWRCVCCGCGPRGGSALRRCFMRRDVRSTWRRRFGRSRTRRPTSSRSTPRCSRCSARRRSCCTSSSPARQVSGRRARFRFTGLRRWHRPWLCCC
jgi:hypothetical protein